MGRISKTRQSKAPGPCRNPGACQLTQALSSSQRMQDIPAHHLIYTQSGQVRQYDYRLLYKQAGRRKIPSTTTLQKRDPLLEPVALDYLLSHSHPGGNSLADSLSKYFHTDHEWELYPSVAYHVFWQWRILFWELFTTKHNKKHLAYCSQPAQSLNSEVDISLVQ